MRNNTHTPSTPSTSTPSTITPATPDNSFGDMELWLQANLMRSLDEAMRLLMEYIG